LLNIQIADLNLKEIVLKEIEVSVGTVPYPLLKTLQVRYRIPSATGMGYGNFRQTCNLATEN